MEYQLILIGFMCGAVVFYPLGWITGDWFGRYLIRRKALGVARKGYDRDVRMKDEESKVVSYVRMP